MTAGMSVTDIAASISLDYASFMQGMKMVEQRFVDFSKSTASPFYPGSAPDQGGAHVQAFIDEQIKADGRMTALIIANRQRVHQFDQEAHAYRIRAAKETADLEKRISDAKLLESQRVAEMHKYEQQQRKQEADDRMEASNAIRRRMERDAELQSSISEIFGRQNQRLEDQAHKGDYLYALNKRQTQERKALLSVIADIVHHEKMLGTFDAERAKVLKEITASFKILQQQEQEAAANGIKTDAQERVQRAANERLDTERKIEAVLNRQAAQYDEVYAFELKQRAARSEFARLLLQAKSQGVSNENLMGAATQFREAQAREKEAFNASRIAKENAANAEELANWKQQDAHVQALRLNQMEQEQNLQKRGAALIRSLATAQDLHNERVQEYGHMLRANIITQKQYTQAVAQSNAVMRASASGAGAYTGMLAQASFAAEDFIQGIAMGDLRSALLGASNNLTMVARGAFQAAEGVTVLGMNVKTFLGYLIGIPAAVAGLAIAFAEVNRAKRETLSLDEAIREAQQGYGIREINQQAKERARDEKLRIENIDTILQAEKDLKKQTEDQLKLRERLTMEETKRSATASRMIENLLGGPMAVTEFEQIMNNMKNSGDQASKDLAMSMERNISQATQALTSGDVNRSIQNLRELYERMNDIIYSRNRLEDVGSGLNAPFESLQYLINDPTALDSLEELFQAGVVFAGENDQALNDLRDKMTQVGMESLRIKKELEQATANEQQLEQRLQELRADGLRLLNEQFKEKQRIAEQERMENAAAIANEARLLEEKRKRAVFDMTATDQQKEMLRIQEQMFEFMGPASIVQGFAPPGVLGAPEMLAQLQQEGKAAGMQFLQAQATLLEKEIEALQQASSPEILGGMQQNALQAQADAFKQMFATANKQNPQLTALGQKLDAIRNAIQSGNILQVVGP